MANGFVEAPPKGRPGRSPIESHGLEDHASIELGVSLLQQQNLGFGRCFLNGQTQLDPRSFADIRINRAAPTDTSKALL
jgi:hypothetical protein